jgi:fibro-slime domain-containing protein
MRTTWPLLLLLVACGPHGLRGDPDAMSGDDDDDGPPDARPGAPDAAPVVVNDGSLPNGCNLLPVILRDFRVSHPDFEHFTSDAVTPGLVEAELGADGTPTYAHPGGTICTTGPAEFAHWYHDTPGTNMRVEIDLELTETSNGVFVYDSDAFFPLDGQGFGNEAMAHNFAFTTEIHTTFEYRAGDSFTFRGDDDVWLFVNGRLALDLGGLHQPATGTIGLDAQAAALGITPGEIYPMDIFQAERHTSLSNFRIETTIPCFVVP